MARATIEYLNSRRESKAASGGTNHRKRELSDKVQQKRRTDAKAVFAGLDAIERAAVEIDSMFAEFRSWIRNRPSVQTIADGEDLEF